MQNALPSIISLPVHGFSHQQATTTPQPHPLQPYENMICDSIWTEEKHRLHVGELCMRFLNTVHFKVYGLKSMLELDKDEQEQIL